MLKITKIHIDGAGKLVVYDIVRSITTMAAAKVEASRTAHAHWRNPTQINHLEPAPWVSEDGTGIMLIATEEDD